MTMLDRCVAYLKENHIRYAHSIHSPGVTAREVAANERMPAHNLAKTVVYVGDCGYGMAILPADCVVDFMEVCRLLGLSEFRLATERELAALFPGCEIGAMPPFGNFFNMPVLMDESLAACEFMAFTAGTHRDALHMSVADFHHLVNPLVASFAVRAPTALASR